MGKITQIEAIAYYLRKNKKLTSLEAIKKFGAIRLSGTIYRLKNEYGFEIRTEIKTVQNRYGSTSNIAIYHLEKDGDL